MQSERLVLAESARLHRFFSKEPWYVSLIGDAVCFERRSGATAVEIPVRSLDMLAVSSALFCSRVVFQATDGRKHSIGGVDGESALRLRDAVLREIALHAMDVGSQVKRIDERLGRSLAGGRYIRYSQSGEFADLRAEFVSVLQECGELLRGHLDEEAAEALERLAILDTDEGFEAARMEANGVFVANSIPSVQDAANSVLSNPLTEEQAEAIASDEDTTLVLAGAGSGKTAVIVGKVAHLVRNCGVPPSDILVLAYNKKAAEEIRERLYERLSDDIPLHLLKRNVSTFHAFGRRILSKVDGAPNISKLAEDNAKLVNTIEEILRNFLHDSKQSQQPQEVIRFIADHPAPYRSAFDFATRPEYDEYVRSIELRTLNGDLVKSFEELVVANYLTEHGIKFEYERNYEHATATRERRQYRPDFFLSDYGIYIEHFALNEEGSPPPGWQQYLDGVQWKRNIHRQYGTKLIETYSWQYRQGNLLPQLRSQLEGRGVRFRRVPIQHLIKKLAEQLVSWLARLLVQFLNHVKGQRLGSAELRARARVGGDHQRNDLFLDIFDMVYARYRALLTAKGERDFHDLINCAVDHILSGKWISPYRYVLVDEFQDISEGRMALLKALRATGVAYFLVGDDWQSIYRFAGSDVSLMRDCGSHLGHVKEQVLSQTFRFGDGILGPSTAFVQRNPEQIKRPFRSTGRSEDEGITIIACEEPKQGLEDALQEIEERAQGKPCSVLVLGRYNASRKILSPRRQRGSVRVDFSTVHTAKGLETDYAVVLDLKRDRFGFPSQIEDDPLLEMVLPPKSRGIPYAEERRLFYVAMTRARIGAYLITDAARPSGFVTELLRESEPDSLRMLSKLAPECPRCPSGRLRPSQSGKNMSCSNNPNCEHLAPRCPNCNEGYAVVSKRVPQTRCTNPDCDDPPSACPSCGIGVLLLRNGPYGSFWGCSEYPSEPSCRYIMDIADSGRENNA